MRVTLVIPCHNEQEVLPELFQRVTAAAPSWGYSWEVLCVDDGSKDRTWDLLVEQYQRDSRWKAIRLSRNFGHQVALSAGLQCADGDAVVVMDADLQDPPEELARFLETWREGFEVVYAVRQGRKERWWKRLCYWGFYRVMSRLVPFEIPLDSGDFCVMDRKVVEVLRSMPERNRFVRGLRAWSGFRQTGLSYTRASRQAGQSKYTVRKLIRLGLDGILSFSSLPLTWVAAIGFWISGCSLLGILFTLATKVFKNTFARFGMPPVQGFTTIVICILFLGGLQLLSLGVVGQYIARIYDEVKRRPSWIVRDSLGQFSMQRAPGAGLEHRSAFDGLGVNEPGAPSRQPNIAARDGLLGVPVGLRRKS
jgi:polyisoprenyl-phosphate glycosyltransferase